MEIGIKNVASEGAVIVFEKPFCLNGGIASKEWWMSWEKITDYIKLGLDKELEDNPRRFGLKP